MKNKLIAIAAIALAPAFAFAQGATSGATGVQQDTGTSAGAVSGGAGVSGDTGTVQSSSEGRLAHKRSRRHDMGLTPDQVKQLQTAINQAGCQAGQPDGVVGAQTRQGIACVKKQKGITGNNIDDVLSALNLGFTAGTSTSESG
ncbi:MAG TPA: hypothetical protein VF488_01770, partial [Gemmatimonadaceae bacterium]